MQSSDNLIIIPTIGSTELFRFLDAGVDFTLEMLDVGLHIQFQLQFVALSFFKILIFAIFAIIFVLFSALNSLFHLLDFILAENELDLFNCLLHL